jgi:hypothetical protein
MVHLTAAHRPHVTARIGDCLDGCVTHCVDIDGAEVESSPIGVHPGSVPAAGHHAQRG